MTGHLMEIVSNGYYMHEVSNPVFGNKIRKKNHQLSSAKTVPRMVKTIFFIVQSDT